MRSSACIVRDPCGGGAQAAVWTLAEIPFGNFAKYNFIETRLAGQMYLRTYFPRSLIAQRTLHTFDELSTARAPDIRNDEYWRLL
jgi:hypothetical protein